MPFGTMLVVAGACLLLGGFGAAWLRALGLARGQALGQIAALLALHHWASRHPAWEGLLLLYSLPFALSTLRQGLLGVFALSCSLAAGALADTASLSSGPEPWLSVPLAAAGVASFFPLPLPARMGAAAGGVALLCLLRPTIDVEGGVEMLLAALALMSLIGSVLLPPEVQGGAELEEG